jgi:hypothetical protein
LATKYGCSIRKISEIAIISPGLSQSLRAEFDLEVASIKKETEKEQVMQIVTSWMEQGIEQGEQKATLKSVLRVLHRRVGELDADVNERLQLLDLLRE